MCCSRHHISCFQEPKHEVWQRYPLFVQASFFSCPVFSWANFDLATNRPGELLAPTNGLQLALILVAFRSPNMRLGRDIRCLFKRVFSPALCFPGLILTLPQIVMERY